MNIIYHKNRVKDTNHLSLDIEKTFEKKFNIPLDASLRESRDMGDTSQYNKDNIQQVHSQHYT